MTDPVSVHDAAEIAALSGETVSVKGDGIVDADLEGIGRVTRLEALHLDGCHDLGDAALAGLPALRKLCFCGVGNLSDSWLETLAASTSLRELVLMGCRGETEEGLAAFRARCPDVSVEVM